ncbi:MULTISPECIES: NAD(P)H-dependent glycerol-3-phosphate dehydrogenase [Anoxybacillus]|uniref:Glycerol-3-phosphate dehydrogenase [NAD(P)+] n=1 Tax=Anoxybacillus flavithermus TaxID=33934 RepID=A0A178TCW8_9BACL|nr:NAD(P)H-dependent glycerol-3-phosphate dehydrogenase [Anoxybacillus flavithermus]ASA95676.1 glycerol-3-phosphate dehydrogenase [Anoxybacillus flavithermus]ELK22233.1 glycerol-3-phosphate dehydrogenase [NAD(P)+] [Anoxybacillus flavithermus TNO-09.006]MBE2906011.1 NAD(P)H-dependent glycerol-3-phosphate dehydrogenase [Anoxybacillus flavithermus]MBE2907084.1 NAD(P)H-dependent glycerol-3-phosphate dehydrogenase [Anoxybacillus flavithermus]MBE2910209.1 NAD(P)H-dependent glycerol-3-phosphate dehyd
MVAVLGAGSWGTALAIVLADNGHDVRLWGQRQEQIDEINEKHMNEKYLPNIHLPEAIVGYVDLAKALEGVETVVLAVPTKAIRDVLQRVRTCVKQPITIVSVSKGIEPDTHKRISEIIEEEMPAHLLQDVVVLSGPSHAEEVSLRHPTTVTVSSKNMEAAERIQDLFMNHQYFRVYTNPDLIGVEIGGALKNIIALAAGITDGLGYGDNAKAALMTRGLAEMARLGSRLGANPLTFAGLTGIGDLIVTCTSVHSRNWRAGNLLGKGYALDDVLANMGMVVEGVRTTKAAYQLAKKMNVDMPITNALYDVLFNGKDVKSAVDSLMARGKTSELEDLANISL